MEWLTHRPCGWTHSPTLPSCPKVPSITRLSALRSNYTVGPCDLAGSGLSINSNMTSTLLWTTKTLLGTLGNCKNLGVPRTPECGRANKSLIQWLPAEGDCKSLRQIHSKGHCHHGFHIIIAQTAICTTNRRAYIWKPEMCSSQTYKQLTKCL